MMMMMAMTMPHRRPSRPSSIPAADDTRDPAPIPDDRVPIAVWHLGIDAHDECDSSSKDKASLYAQESKRQEVFVVDCLLLHLLTPFPNPTRCSPRPRRCARTGCPYRVPCTDLHTPKHPQNDIFRQFRFSNPSLKSPIYLSKSESHAPWARRAHGAVPLCVPAPRALGPHQVGVWYTVVSDRQPRDIRFIFPSAVCCRFRSVTGWAFNTNTWTLSCLFH
jgi:hypothetical protein